MPRYTNAQIDAALHEAHGMVFIAAKRLGCSRNTIKARVEQSAALRETLDLERGLTGDTAELKLYQAIQNGDPWAIQFYLRTRGRDRGYVERSEVAARMEHSGPDGAPARFVVEYVDTVQAPHLPPAALNEPATNGRAR